MKTETSLKLSALILSALLLASGGIGCSKTPSSTQTSDTTEPPASYAVELNYYKGALEKLEVELMKVKEESYIAQAELRNQIATLQQQLDDASVDEKDTSPITPPPSTNGAGNSNNSNNSTEGSSNSNNSNESSDTDKPSSGNISLVTPTIDFSIQSGDDGISVLSYTGNSTSITIPAVIQGSAVTKIADSAFKNSGLSEITVSEGISELGWFAFEGASSLSRITLPASITSIGYGAFDGCPQSMVIVCPRGSYVEAYAQSWGLNYISE